MTGMFEFPSRAGWAALGLVAVATYGTFGALGFSVRLTPLAILLAVGAALFAIGEAYRRLRPDRALVALFSGLAYFVATIATAGVLTYALVPLGGRLWDGAFMGFERALGLDWTGLAAVMSASPAVNALWTFAYTSSFIQIVLTIFVLPGAGRADRLGTYLQLIAATMVVTGIVSILCPAIGPIRSYHVPDEIAAGLGTMGVRHLDQFFALRDGSLRLFDLANMEGLVTFPSFHTVMAILTAWALAPVRVLGPLALVLNVCVLAATIPQGGHYVADVLAGGLIAACAIAAAMRDSGWRAPAPRALAPAG